MYQNLKNKPIKKHLYIGYTCLYHLMLVSTMKFLYLFFWAEHSRNLLVENWQPFQYFLTMQIFCIDKKGYLYFFQKPGFR